MADKRKANNEQSLVSFNSITNQIENEYLVKVAVKRSKTAGAIIAAVCFLIALLCVLRICCHTLGTKKDIEFEGPYNAFNRTWSKQCFWILQYVNNLLLR